MKVVVKTLNMRFLIIYVPVQILFFGTVILKFFVVGQPAQNKNSLVMDFNIYFFKTQLSKIPRAGRN